MNSEDIVKIRKFLHGISNDLSVSIGNTTILTRRYAAGEGVISEEEFKVRIGKIESGIENALKKIETHREWIIEEGKDKDLKSA
ncbi:hypothetical protein N9W79_01300 [bacterium]|nr:hypothetical protein [bacterium]